MRIKSFDVLDVRFPTSLVNAGTDAVHKDPDYSAAYVILKTDGDHEGHGFAFTIGRGNEVVVAAIRALEPLVVGKTIGRDIRRPRRRSGKRSRTTRSCAGSVRRKASSISRSPRSSMRSGIFRRRRQRKPVWKLLADMSPREIVTCIDFRYITDALSPEEATRDAGAAAESPRGPRGDPSARRLSRRYTTSAGWFGYSDEEVRRLCREATGRRMAALQGQGRWRAGRRRPASRPRPRRPSDPTAS